MAETKSTAASSKSGATIMLGGKKFTLVPKLPFKFLRAAQQEDLDEIISICLGPKQAAEFWDLDLGIKEGTEAVQKLIEKAGASLGES